MKIKDVEVLVLEAPGEGYQLLLMSRGKHMKATLMYTLSFGPMHVIMAAKRLAIVK